MSPTHALAFGDLDGGVWGVAWSPSADGPLSIAVGGTDVEGAVLAATLAGGPEDQKWRADGDAVELVLSPSSPPADGAGPGPLGGFDQLCQASGRVTLAGADIEVAAPGWRGTRDGQLKLDRIESFRQVAAWFGPDEGIALVALRPRGARGQDADLVAASVLESRPAPRVEDPRLSTTYSAAGLPARAGLELWFEEPEGDDPHADEEHDGLPRRAAGEAIGAGLNWTAAGFALHAAPLRWHSRGQDGAGVYLLGRRT